MLQTFSDFENRVGAQKFNDENALFHVKKTLKNKNSSRSLAAWRPARSGNRMVLRSVTRSSKLGAGRAARRRKMTQQESTNKETDETHKMHVIFLGIFSCTFPNFPRREAVLICKAASRPIPVGVCSRAAPLGLLTKCKWQSAKVEEDKQTGRQRSQIGWSCGV